MFQCFSLFWFLFLFSMEKTRSPTHTGKKILFWQARHLNVWAKEGCRASLTHKKKDPTVHFSLVQYSKRVYCTFNSLCNAPLHYNEVRCKYKSLLYFNIHFILHYCTAEEWQICAGMDRGLLTIDTWSRFSIFQPSGHRIVYTIPQLTMEILSSWLGI